MLKGSEMKKILLVDDEEDFCYFTKANLEATGDFDVSVCCDSTEATNMAKRQKPDIILLDIVMPGLSGIEIVEELKHNNITRNIPTIFLTALVSEAETKSSQSFIGGRYFISKPVEIRRLEFLINRLLDA